MHLTKRPLHSPYNADKREEDDEGEQGEGDVGLRGDVGMTQPEHMDQHEASDDEHEGRVWNEAAIARDEEEAVIVSVEYRALHKQAYNYIYTHQTECCAW